MSYSDIISRCADDPAFFLALIVWIAFFVGSASFLGWRFISVLWLKALSWISRWFSNRRKK